jgi:hypothetical protein
MYFRITALPLKDRYSHVIIGGGGGGKGKKKKKKKKKGF